ncbi:dTDP-4-dehydrorhamnose reductase [Permianibacter aggregans]|uniref:dTDP-4-dehydrorhamnose reductase n=1 Tax=Permianibacter aggregans TaxID=1510150 RepID=A0A4R6UUR4_9GAMM|nr:dTDP-4-dehydrorhamnose reductase [Permianibacter aggregans]QGX41322.1 dTDP-4-dehydrorhamnose reductase [Permianibacter aggregans]TDQ51108.1 dTDP-4-dehydrorhamnose reductase [Permianibacter aggregans]
MRILLLGKNGQVGWELQRTLSPLGEVIAMGREQANFLAPESLHELVSHCKPNWIVNAAAYTAVDKAESDQEAAFKVNAESVEVLAQQAKRIGAKLVHYSTDYVYDGTKPGTYLETDAVNPVSVYGKSKLAGEEAIRAAGCEHFIFRTSWVFAARGGNFIKTMLRLAAEREQLKVVADQFGAPTSAELIADVTAHCIQSAENGLTDAWGTYHLVAGGETSWHGYACHVIEGALARGVALAIKPESVMPITTEELSAFAIRPKNSRLLTKKMETIFKLQMPNWQFNVDRVLDEIIVNGVERL